MNILYISSVDGGPWAGPTYSVPNQIKSQANTDNVLWYNYYDRSHPEWVSKEWEKLPYYRDLIDIPSGQIRDLPKPFNKPDIIVLEQFYCHARTSLPKQLMNNDAPYVIVPRGELTEAAQKRRSLKKRIFNALYYNGFAGKAAAIQYLTEQERIDSGIKWNQNSIVVPNGVILPETVKTSFHSDSIHAVVIGRIEPYQKGLDLLIEACEKCKIEIKKSNMKIDVYGPDRVGRLTEMQELVKEKGLADVIMFHDAVYGDEKEHVLMDADVFIIPSRFEGHPTALIEALSYGLPALVTTGANMREEIESYDAGWGADTNANDIASCIHKMLSERSSFLIKGICARKLAENYAWDEIAKKSHVLYQSIEKRDM